MTTYALLIADTLFAPFSTSFFGERMFFAGKYFFSYNLINLKINYYFSLRIHTVHKFSQVCALQNCDELLRNMLIIFIIIILYKTQAAT